MRSSRCKDGVILDDHGGVGDDYDLLVTTDPKVAFPGRFQGVAFRLVDESEYWGSDDADEQQESGDEPTAAPPSE